MMKPEGWVEGADCYVGHVAVVCSADCAMDCVVDTFKAVEGAGGHGSS